MLEQALVDDFLSSEMLCGHEQNAEILRFAQNDKLKVTQNRHKENEEAPAWPGLLFDPVSILPE